MDSLAALPAAFTAALAERYRIEREIGVGGMATVYLARDLRHERPVAVKVLKPELGAVLGVERFLSEIRVTANLQHPNLLPLFDSGEAGGLLYYVMPYVEGESLRARLDREKQLPLDEAVRLTIAVAGALDYAHRHGVIHRDLKPENILLHDGQPVVADFGIALAVSNAGGARVTQTGLSLGTPQYMSPEQAAGDRAIDARSDLYSLASVAYEMITGEPPHTGTTAQAIIAKLMTAEPAPLSTLRRSAPVHLDVAIARALQKLPADRFATARDFADALQGKGASFETTTHTTAVRLGPPSLVQVMRHPFAIGMAVLALVAIGFAVTVQRRSSGPDAPSAVVRFPVTAISAVIGGGSVAAWTPITVSPDGRSVAFVGLAENGVSRLYIRAIDELEPREFQGTDGAQSPAFSPAGDAIAFWANGAVQRIAIGGGKPITICTSPAPSGLTWSSSGVIVMSGNANGLATVPVSGGEPKSLTVPDSSKGELYQSAPIALDDGESVLFASQSAGGLARVRLKLVSLKTRAITDLGITGMAPLGVIHGALVYATATAGLSAVRFDAAARRAIGEPTSLGISVVIRPNGAVDAALSASGTLAYQSGATASQVGLLDANGQFTVLLREPRAYFFPRYSPDGSRIAMTVNSGARTDIWVYDLASATLQRLTAEGTVNERPEWTPDGTRVLYRSDRGARSALWWQPFDRSAPATTLLEHSASDFFEGVITRDGTTLVYQQDNASLSQADLFARAITGDTTRRVVSATPAVEVQPRLSPDGKWVSYITDASGLSEVVVQPFPEGGAQVQVSVSGGAEPVWGRDGSHLFYRDGRSIIMAEYVTTPRFAITKRQLFATDQFVAAQAPHANYDVSPDGKRLLMVKSVEASRLVVAYNWGAELRARLQGKN